MYLDCVSVFRMALNYENMSVEERAKERATRGRKMEDWPKREPIEKVLVNLGKRLTAIQELTEDMLVTLGAATEATAAATRTTVTNQLRVQYAVTTEALKHAELDCRYGVGTADQLYDHAAEVSYMSDGEAKALKDLLKKRAEAAAGADGKGKSKFIPNKPYERPGYSKPETQAGWPWAPPPTMPMAAMSMPPMGMGQMYGWPMGGAQFPGMAQGGLPTMPMGMPAASGAAAASPGPAAGAGGHGGGRKRFPCDNCGSMEHWKSSPSCPNYHLFVSAQLTKAEAFRNAAQGGQQGQQPAAGGSGQGGPALLALQPPGTGDLFFCIFQWRILDYIQYGGILYLEFLFCSWIIQHSVILFQCSFLLHIWNGHIWNLF